MARIPYLNWKISNQFIYALIGTIVGAYIGGNYSYQATHDIYEEQQNKEIVNVAKAIYIDVSDTSDRINNSLIQYNQAKNNYSKVDNNLLYIDPRPFYSNNGAYFIYATEICKLDDNLPVKIDVYYRTVLDLEYEGQYIESRYSKNLNNENLSSEEQMYLDQYSKHLPINMERIVYYADDIKKQLNETYNLHMELPQRYTDNFPPSYMT